MASLLAAAGTRLQTLARALGAAGASPAAARAVGPWPARGETGLRRQLAGPLRPPRPTRATASAATILAPGRGHGGTAPRSQGPLRAASLRPPKCLLAAGAAPPAGVSFNTNSRHSFEKDEELTGAGTCTSAVRGPRPRPRGSPAVEGWAARLVATGTGGLVCGGRSDDPRLFAFSSMLANPILGCRPVSSSKIIDCLYLVVVRLTAKVT